MGGINYKSITKGSLMKLLLLHTIAYFLLITKCAYGIGSNLTDTDKIVPLELPMSPQCSSDSKIMNQVVLLILDRTTALSKDTKQRWKTGVKKIFSSPNVVGDVYFLEVRKTMVGLKELGHACLDRYVPVKQHEVDPAPNSINASEWWKWGKAIVEHHSNENKNKSEDNNSRMINARAYRAEYLKQLTKIIEYDIPTKDSTEISRSLMSMLESYCSKKSICHVFIFSDLLDTAAKTAIRNGEKVASMAGASRAKDLFKQFKPILQNTRLEIIVWSFGRDDSAPDVDLTEDRSLALRSYWESFFGEINAHAPNSATPLITNDLPNDF